MKLHSLLSTFSVLAIVILSLSFAPEIFAFKTDDPLNTQKASANEALQDTDVSRFTNAIAEIKDYYVQPIGDKKLLEDAIRGMLSGLDPHSEYLDADAYKTLLMTTSGSFGGLGIEVTGEYGVLKVVSPIDDTPAAKAGIKSGDYIVAIEGKLVNEMSLREAVDKMRGKKGTAVTLTIIRKGEKNPMAFKLIRDEIKIASVKSNMLENGFGYVRISEFQDPTSKLMIEAINNLKKSQGGKLQGLVLDLRNNPGGLLESAVQVVNAFLDSKKLDNKFNSMIVYTEGRLASAQYSAKATGEDILGGAPLVILVNEGSASASEIVAGALQDYHRAMIVGVNSFGKGSVQTVLPLDDSHAIKLTTALYHTPSGRVIQNIGIIPDIKVDNLTITTAKVDNAMMSPIREYELKGHLKGAENSTTPLADPKTDSMALAQSDYQLYEALRILKTMAMLDKKIINLPTPTSPVTPAITKK